MVGRGVLAGDMKIVVPMLVGLVLLVVCDRLWSDEPNGIKHVLGKLPYRLAMTCAIGGMICCVVLVAAPIASSVTAGLWRHRPGHCVANLQADLESAVPEVDPIVNKRIAMTISGPSVSFGISIMGSQRPSLCVGIAAVGILSMKHRDYSTNCPPPERRDEATAARFRFASPRSQVEKDRASQGRSTRCRPSLGSSWYDLSVMAMPASQRPTTLDEALVQLKRDPGHPVQANIGELEIELRVIAKTPDADQGGPYDSLLASAGTAEAFADDVARHKRSHLADIYAPKRKDR
jgi:hypothetical protein